MFYNKDGQPIPMDGIATDITHRKQMPETLLKNEEKFRKIFSESPVGMAVVGLDNRVVQVNERLCEMVGYTEDELMSLTFSEITPVDDIELDTQFAQQLLQEEIPYYTLAKWYLKKNQEAENVLNIINDILDFSKLEAGQQELESLEFNLKQCLEEVMQLLATPAHNKGLELAT